MNPTTNDSDWAIILKIIFASQGFFLPLTRISEPFFYEIVKNKSKAFIQQYICCCGAEARRKQKELDERFNDKTFMERNLKKLTSTNTDSSLPNISSIVESDKYDSFKNDEMRKDTQEKED